MVYRVLHIMAAADAGGISTVILNYYRYMDREKIHFDIAITTDVIGQNGHRLKELGCHIYHLPLKSEGLNKYTKSLKELLRKEHFDAVHVHDNETSYVALRIAKQMGIKKRIAHAHTSSPTSNLKQEIRRVSGCFLNSYYATNLIGCGILAGNRVFGKRNMKKSKSIVLPNAIDTEKFKYNSVIRNEVRKELALENKYVIGMIGRLDYQKNHLFVLNLLDSVYAINKNITLVLVGNGLNELVIKKLIREKHMEEYVKVLGRRSDVNRLYQAFDMFLLPSLFEGFPVAAVESITSGLPTLIADTITEELKFSELVEYIPLDSKKWIDSILNCKENLHRENSVNNVREHKLDILDTAKILEEVYLDK